MIPPSKAVMRFEQVEFCKVLTRSAGCGLSTTEVVIVEND